MTAEHDRREDDRWRRRERESSVPDPLRGATTAELCRCDRGPLIFAAADGEQPRCQRCGRPAP